MLVTGGIAGVPSSDPRNPPVGTPIESAELYDPATGTWSAAAAMGAARSAHIAVLLTAGPHAGRVLVTGGQRSAPGATAEVYDPATNTWAPVAAMTTPRQGHSGALLSNGKVLVAGGLNDSSHPFFGAGTGEVYDPVADSWTATPLAVTRQRFVLVPLPNARALITGGWPNYFGVAEIFE